MCLTVVVDYSKCRNLRLDNQFNTSTVVPYVVSRQTLQD